ncbi:hypothetical protein [Sphingorhabdus sp.]|jgi:hypothetical protein|uniref:hypothetical protein n=1 Tax=Sphingorhabdus sp. TaxID=1902408 RepID=UPI0037CAD5C1
MKRSIYVITLAMALAIVPFLSVPAFAQAKIDFAIYEGPPKVATGEGGTKITKNGIDYWTTGTPPRRYQIIGFVQDRRDELMDGGHAIGSPSIASKVKRAGGNAVIVESQDEVGKTGGFGSASPFFGFLAMGGSKTVTRMIVVKYLPDEVQPVSPAEAAKE